MPQQGAAKRLTTAQIGGSGMLSRVPQGVRADLLADPGEAGDPAHDAGGAVPVEPLAIGGEEERPFGALADGQVDGAGGARGERDGDDRRRASFEPRHGKIWQAGTSFESQASKPSRQRI
jgi:hypothetical protein